MSQLEVKEKELNKLKQECDQLVLNQHPASDKIEVCLNLPSILSWYYCFGGNSCSPMHTYLAVSSIKLSEAYV